MWVSSVFKLAVTVKSSIVVVVVVLTAIVVVDQTLSREGFPAFPVPVAVARCDQISDAARFLGRYVRR